MDSIPLVLPPTIIDGDLTSPFPIVLVRTLSDVTQVRNFLAELPQYKGSNGFIRHLYDNFSELKIIPLQSVSEKITSGEKRWARFDTLPWDEIDQLS